MLRLKQRCTGVRRSSDFPIGAVEKRLGTLTGWTILLLGICMPAVGTYIAFAGLFQGAGETRTTLRINAWSTLAFQIPASAVLGFVLSMGAPGIWLAFPLGFVLKAVLALRAYRQGTWAKVGKRV